MREVRVQGRDVIICLLALILVVVATRFFLDSAIANSQMLTDGVRITTESGVLSRDINIAILTIAIIYSIFIIGIVIIVNKVVLYRVRLESMSVGELLLGVTVSMVPGPLLGAFFINTLGVRPGNPLITLILVIAPLVGMSYLLKERINDKGDHSVYVLNMIRVSAILIVLLLLF